MSSVGAHYKTNDGKGYLDVDRVLGQDNTTIMLNYQQMVSITPEQARDLGHFLLTYCVTKDGKYLDEEV